VSALFLIYTGLGFSCTANNSSRAAGCVASYAPLCATREYSNIEADTQTRPSFMHPQEIVDFKGKMLNFSFSHSHASSEDSAHPSAPLVQSCSQQLLMAGEPHRLFSRSFIFRTLEQIRY